MSVAKVGAVAVGLVGLYLLASRGDGAASGFGGGGGGREDGPGDTIITFPELDLSGLWDGTLTKKSGQVIEEYTGEHGGSLDLAGLIPAEYPYNIEGKIPLTTPISKKLTAVTPTKTPSFFGAALLSPIGAGAWYNQVMQRFRVAPKKTPVYTGRHGGSRELKGLKPAQYSYNLPGKIPLTRSI